MIIRKAKLNDINGCVKISHIEEFTSINKMSDKEAKKYLTELRDAWEEAGKKHPSNLEEELTKGGVNIAT